MTTIAEEAERVYQRIEREKHAKKKSWKGRVWAVLIGLFIALHSLDYFVFGWASGNWSPSELWAWSTLYRGAAVIAGGFALMFFLVVVLGWIDDWRIRRRKAKGKPLSAKLLRRDQHNRHNEVDRRYAAAKRRRYQARRQEQGE